jgi:hypothetical protein
MHCIVIFFIKVGVDMEKKDFQSIFLKLIERIQLDLRETELVCSDYLVKEKIHNILDYIELETIDNKAILEELIKEKIKETKCLNAELNTSFYFLYRNFLDGKITIKDAQAMYDMYAKELKTS